MNGTPALVKVAFKGPEAIDQHRRFDEMIVEHRDDGSAFELRAVSHLQRDVLVIVQNRRGYPCVA